MAPRPIDMLRRCDAALVIGDAALFFDHERMGVQKVDLGEHWTAMSGLRSSGRSGQAARRP